MTDNIHDQEVVKISTKPFLVIAILLVALISIGSIANNIRMKNRFNSLVDHSKVIYNAHKVEIEEIFKVEENLPNIKSVLNNINLPEKTVYFIDIIRNVDGKWILYDDQSSNINKSIVSQTNINLIQNYINLNHNEKFTFQKNLRDFYIDYYKYPYYNKDFLLSILPINQEGKVVGYFIVATSKVQFN